MVVAPNCLRGFAPSREVAAALAAGVRQALPGVSPLVLPLADGGNGTLDVVASRRGGTVRTLLASDALGQPRPTSWLALDDHVAVVETAAICGFGDLPVDRLRPLRATSAGVGQTIDDALTAETTALLVGLGGTVTVDGGAGALHALGARFVDASGNPVRPDPVTMLDVVRVDLEPARRRLRGVTVRLLPDVSTPLADAVALFGPQKGLGDQDRPRVATALAHLAELLADTGARERLHAEWFGAGGGIGFGLASVAATTVRPGAQELLDLLDPQGVVLSADLVITAEGRVDHSTWQGKLPGTIASRRAERGLPTALVATRFDTEPPGPLIRFHSLPAPGPLAGEALARALAAAAARCVTPGRPGERR